MSQVESNPLVANTIEIKKQNQQIEITEPISMLSITPDKYIRSSMPFDTQQITFPGVASMFKYDENFVWSINDLPNTKIYTLELTLQNLLRFAPLGTGQQVLVNMKSITLMLENTFNPFYQGSLLIYYDPSPSDEYYDIVFDAPETQNMAWQYKQRDLILTKNRDPYMMEVDVNIPFNFFQIANTYPAAQDYIIKYSFGRIRIMVNTRLQTKSLKTTLSMRASVAINDYTTAGNRFQ